VRLERVVEILEGALDLLVPPLDQRLDGAADLVSECV
jgi:hypothetical protein